MPHNFLKISVSKIRARIMRACILTSMISTIVFNKTKRRHVSKICAVALIAGFLTACSSTAPQISETMRLKLGSIIDEFRENNPQWDEGTLELLPSAPNTLRLLFRGGRLTNLQTLTNLPITELIFDRVQFDDLSFISNLKLESLQIFSNTEINLNGIEQQKNLRNLLIRFLTPASCTLAPNALADLPLKKLSIQNAIIAVPFPTLPSLEILTLEYCSGIDDFSFLSHALKLKNLELNACTDLDLQTMPPIPVETVSLRFSPALNLQALNRLKNLKTLTISAPQSLDFLKDSRIESLFVINSDITLNLEILATLNVQELELINCPLNSISPLSQCQNLKTLNLTLNQISNLAPLAGLKIQHLFVGGNPITSLEPLAQCRQLQSLFITQCPITSLKPLAGLPNLQILKIEKTPISSLEPLISLPIREIWLSECPINNLEPLTQMTKLQKIHLQNLPSQTSIPQSLRAKTTVKNHERN